MTVESENRIEFRSMRGGIKCRGEYRALLDMSNNSEMFHEIGRYGANGRFLVCIDQVMIYILP